MGSTAITSIIHETGLKTLFDQALLELPEGLNENQGVAWVSKRMLELAEKQRRTQQTSQALLVAWLAGGPMGAIWTAHPDGYPSLRDFLRSIGTPDEGNQLSESVISELVAVGDDIVPYANQRGINVVGVLAGTGWTKFREAIPYLRKCAKDNDDEAFSIAMDNIANLPSRDAVRELYRKPHERERTAIADRVEINGIIYFVVACRDQMDAMAVQAAISRNAAWDAVAHGKPNGQGVEIKVSI